MVFARTLILVLVAVLPAFPAADPAQLKSDAESKRIQAYLGSLPPAQVPVLTQEQAMALVAMPLACIDRPQAKPRADNYLYLYDGKPRLLDDYDKSRAFYGCFDWHSAVNSTWTMLVVLRQFPQIPVASLIREKLNDHLGPKNIAGETAFFRESKAFEQPYGRAWVLKLAADLRGWNDPEARTWAINLDPLVKLFENTTLEYLKKLPYLTRTGVHANTAYSMSLVLDYADAVQNEALQKAVSDTARRLFLTDSDCPTAYEPGAAEFLSPCLEEAKLMSRVLPQPEFVQWFDRFMPPVYSAEFQPLTKPFDTSGITDQDQLAGKSHLIGLAFSRAEAMLSIAARLPAEDPRVAVFRRVAAINGQKAMQDLEGAGYFGSHWLGTYALRYFLAANAMPQRER